MKFKRIINRLRAAFRPPVARHNIFFLHLPKCAGMAVRDAIVKAYQPFLAYPQHPVVKFSETAARKTEQLSGRPADALRRELLCYMMSQPQVQCIAGHFHYSQAAFDAYHQGWHFITILRNPIDRWISHYLYNLDTTHNVYAIDTPVAEFIRTERGRALGSVVVQNLSERNAEDAREPDAIAEAINRLKRFTLIGCVENMVKFENDFKARFGQALKVPHRNVTIPEKRQRSATIRTEYGDQLAEVCAPDLRLYEAMVDAGRIELP